MRALKSISAQVAPNISEVRAAVRIVNSSARALMLVSSRRTAMKRPISPNGSAAR